MVDQKKRAMIRDLLSNSIEEEEDKEEGVSKWNKDITIEGLLMAATMK